MNIDEEISAAPGWTVTYADLMSLLLTFFILIASMSEVRENDKYQGVADSMHEHFGHVSLDSLKPGESKPRNPLFAALTLAGRSKRTKLLENGSKQIASDATEITPRVRVVRLGSRTTVGTVVYFDQPSAELDAEAREDLVETAELLRGKPQKIEIRGHSAQQAVGGDSSEAWKLAFERTENTMNFLVEQLRIEPERIRLSIAGTNEPASRSDDTAEQLANTRVEVFLLDEVAGEPIAGSQSAALNLPRRF
jgi:chemotaxis protein MotB